ncbi:MAG: SGNH/GDSL hydrolase family protein [Ruminococcaceae bacterium]|nr:SGNH/GDSL hydrolase family protein [Oscillospiraceae bacterium]
MKKTRNILVSVLCIVLCLCMISCSNTETPNDQSSEDPNSSTPEDKGKLSIDDIYAWVDYPASDFCPIFSMPENAEKLTFTYDTEALSIDAEKNTVKALKEGEYTVMAKSESFEAEFKVTAQKIDRTAKGTNGKVKFNSKEFSSQAYSRKNQWNDKGVDGSTTVFIGDSFFDTAFWSNFYTTSYRDTDSLCLGVGATTTYDWEDWLSSGWIGKIKPKNIVMHVGTNNVYDDGENVAETVSSLQRMFTLMHAKHPEIPIYWFGISQRSYDAEKIANVDMINAKMKKWCDARDYITYIDTPSQLKNDMLKDSVHPKVEYYSIFVDALAKTDIEIIETPKADTSVIEDLSFKTSHSISAGSSLTNIIYKDVILTSNYILEGKLDIIKRSTNAHIQFGILDNGNERILLWDNASDGNIKIVIPYDTANVPAEDIYKHQNGTTLTLTWKIVVTDDDVYFYVNDELKLVYAAQKNLDKHPLTIGTEGVECKFYEMKAITKASDAAAFEAALGEMSDVIELYGSKTAAQKIRA